MLVIWQSRMECMIIEVRVEEVSRELMQYNGTGSGMRMISRSTTITHWSLGATTVTVYERINTKVKNGMHDHRGTSLRKNKYERKKLIHQKHKKT